MRYKRRTKPVEARQVKKGNSWDLIDWLGYEYAGSPDDWKDYPIMIETINGTVQPKISDYIVKETLDSGTTITHIYDEVSFNLIFEPLEN